MPIAINVASCECHELSTMMFSNIDELSTGSIKYDEKVCLSDMGTAIESACKTYKTILLSSSHSRTFWYKRSTSIFCKQVILNFNIGW